MRHIVIFIFILGAFSCSKDEDSTSTEMRKLLLSCQWELKDTILHEGAFIVIHDFQRIDFQESTFKLYQNRTVEDENGISKDSITINGSYSYEYPQIRLNADLLNLSGEMSKNNLILYKEGDPYRKLLFKRK